MALDINIHQFLIIFLLLPTFVFNDSTCFAPNQCMTPVACAKRLSEKNSHVLYQCDDRYNICCPPPDTMTRNSQTSSYDIVRPYHDNRRPETQTTTVCHSCGSTRKDGIPSQSSKPNGTIRLRSHRNFRLLPSKCGAVASPDRITEGEEAELGEFPWMALIGLRDRRGKMQWICGGTLISPRYVLTAAHCVHDKSNSVPVVRLGEHNVDTQNDCDATKFCLNSTVDYNVEKIIVHEQWNSTTIKSDIALFRLPRNAPESESVSPICLPVDMKPRNSSEGIKYDVAGWGKTEWNAHNGSSVLRKGTLSSVSDEDCEDLCKGKRKEKYCPITPNQICAQGYKSVDVCKGDSGGPLMLMEQKMYQIGITSFKISENCGADNIPSVFTRVESYLEWILDNMTE